MSTDTNTSTLIDELAELRQAPLATDSKAGTDPAPADSDAATANGNEQKPEYTNVLRTVSAADLDNGAAPEGCMSVTDFAAHLTMTAMMERMQKGETVDATSYVNYTNVLNACKAKRDPLPTVLVQDADGSVRPYIPVNEGTEAWNNRPVRGSGEGRATSGRLDDDKLIKVYRETKEAIEKAENRITKANELLAKKRPLLERRVSQLEARFGKDEWEKKVEAVIEAEEAAKAIPDNDELPAAA